MGSNRLGNSAAWVLASLLASGCASTTEPGEEQILGDAFTVRPIGPNFVLHNGQRVSIERALFDLREAVRAADSRGEPRPVVRIELPSEPPIGDALNRLRSGADLAGVDRIEIEQVDS